MATEGSSRARSTNAHKVLNNNVVVTVNQDGRERVLMGRGIGFKLKPNDAIDYSLVEKTFVLDGAGDAAHAEAVLRSTSYPVASAVADSIEVAERTLGRDLGQHIALAVMDHIGFVLERLQKGIRIPTATMPELSVLYPEEYRAAQSMVDLIASRLDVALPPEEAVFLTTHLLNATQDQPNGTANLLFRRVQHIVALVEQQFAISLDTTSADYIRFILHMKFLLQRLVTETMLRGADSSFYEFAVQRYPAAYLCAQKVRDYVLASTQSTLTDEEMLYVIVHIERLTRRTDDQG